MDRRLEALSKDLRLVSVLDRDQLADRLEAWDRLGLPEHDDIELSFKRISWERPVFGEQATLEEATARTARIVFNRHKQNVTFDTEFKVFSANAQRFELAGLRPWTRRESGQRMKIRPDEQTDLLGTLASSLARLARADFTTVRRTVLSAKIPSLSAASYLLFATHPMREAETIDGANLAPYLTFYAFGDTDEEPFAEGTAAVVHEVISLLEVEAGSRAAPLSERDVERHRQRAERLRIWLQSQTHLGGASLFEQERYALPIPVALVAVVSEHEDLPLRWSKPCVAMFEYLAETDPARLIRLIDGGALSPADLTFAAEVAGKLPAELAVASLLRLLTHVSPVVREGAVYGLAQHRSDLVDTRLRQIATNDDSLGVRETAASLFEDV